MTQQFHYWEYIYEETRNLNLKEYMHTYIHWSVIYHSQDLGTTQVPISRRVDKKLWSVYTMEYYSAIKKKSYYLQ